MINIVNVRVALQMFIIYKYNIDIALITKSAIGTNILTINKDKPADKQPV